MKTRIQLLALCFLFIFGVSGTSKAQDLENKYQSRIELDLSYKALKKLKINFSPQLRFDENFSLDEYLFEAGAEYKVTKFLELGANYRLEVNPRKTKETEYFNGFSLSATLKEKLGDFEPAFRVKYSNYADDDESNQNFLRYKAALEYDIPKSKITPFVSAEAFQLLDGGGLYKMRYSTGIDYKLFKNNYLAFSYKFDYFKKEYVNKHIFSVGYKIKF